MTTRNPVRILAISGSLRRASSNTALVAAAAQLAPDGVEVSIFSGLAELPPFNPDLDETDPPEAIVGFRARLQACDALLISSPEYAHGVPGVLKNALDWVVGSGELMGKPVALVNASPRATRAWALLAETVTVMSARVILDASITVPVQGRTLSPDEIIHDTGLSTLLRSAIDALVDAAREPQAV